MIPESHSLKEKRVVLRRIKDKVHQKFNVSIAEVAENDVWQSGVLGFAIVANERRFCEAMVAKVVNFIDGEAKISDDEKDFVQYGDEPLSAEDYPHWEPEEDSPGGGRSKKPRAPKLPGDEPFPWETGEDD
jgi:uncharacterized protein YlxP (DUF503 family)